MVFPAPYVKQWIDPGSAAKWDLLVVADQHFFNVKSVEWLLEEVINRNHRLRTARIAVVGHVRRFLEDLWRERLPTVEWLGFVSDLESVRNSTRLTICPDRAGTEFRVKL